MKKIFAVLALIAIAAGFASEKIAYAQAVGNGSAATPPPFNCATPYCTVNTPPPIATLPPLATPSPLASPGFPYFLSSANVLYFWNGTQWVPTTSTAPFPMYQAAVPSATSPVSTPSALPVPTASAGSPPPAQAPEEISFPTCEAAGGLAVITSQNFLALQCDLSGRLFVNADDPTSTYVQNSIASATTTVIKTGVAGRQIYVYLATTETTGSAGGTVQWESSTSNTCASGNTTLLPSAITTDSSAGGFATLWGFQATAPTVAGNMPAAPGKALVLPLGATFCIVTTGTTALTAISDVGIH